VIRDFTSTKGPTKLGHDVEYMDGSELQHRNGHHQKRGFKGGFKKARAAKKKR